MGVAESKLRLFAEEGQLIPTPEEARDREHQRAEQELQLKEQEQQRAERLAEKLRELGIDPADF